MLRGDLKKKVFWDFPGGPVVKTLHVHSRRVGVPFLVGELRSRMLSGVAKK